MRISKFSGFLWVVPSNTEMFLRGLKIRGESRTWQVLLVPEKKIWDNHAFSRDNELHFGKKCHTLLCISLFFGIIVASLSLKKKMLGYP